MMRGEETIFEVFCRVDPGDRMGHIGTLNAPNLELARVYAWKIYDEEDWSDMWVVPREAIASAHPERRAVEARAGTGVEEAG